MAVTTAPASTSAEFDADPLTSNSVDWDGNWTQGVWQNSPSIVSIIQELVDTYTFSNSAIMFQIKNDKGASSSHNRPHDYHYDDHSYGMKLHIEYTAGGGEFGIDELEEAYRVYYEAYDGIVLEGRTDVTEQTEEERATTLAAFKAAFPGDDYYQHNHDHNGTLEPCTQESV